MQRRAAGEGYYATVTDEWGVHITDPIRAFEEYLEKDLDYRDTRADAPVGAVQTIYDDCGSFVVTTAGFAELRYIKAHQRHPRVFGLLPEVADYIDEAIAEYNFQHVDLLLKPCAANKRKKAA